MSGATHPPLPVVVLISGNGSNLQALIDAFRGQDAPVKICAVISNRPHAHGLDRARRAGIAVHVVDHQAFPDRVSFDRALQAAIDAYNPGLVVLAGFMRILTEGFVHHYLGRMVNIHPSLLPNFQGLDTHQRVLDSGMQEHGASIHFVTPQLDGGPVIMRAHVEVKPEDDPQTLAARVLQEEHRIYPEVLRLFAAGRVRLNDNQALLDGVAVPQLPKQPKG